MRPMKIYRTVLQNLEDSQNASCGSYCMLTVIAVSTRQMRKLKEHLKHVHVYVVSVIAQADL